MRKFKRLRGHKTRAFLWLNSVRSKYPNLFVHWTGRGSFAVGTMGARWVERFTPGSESSRGGSSLGWLTRLILRLSICWRMCLCEYCLNHRYRYSQNWTSCYELHHHRELLIGRWDWRTLQRVAMADLSLAVTILRMNLTVFHPKNKSLMPLPLSSMRLWAKSVLVNPHWPDAGCEGKSKRPRSRSSSALTSGQVSSACSKRWR